MPSHKWPTRHHGPCIQNVDIAISTALSSKRAQESRESRKLVASTRYIDPTLPKQPTFG